MSHTFSYRSNPFNSERFTIYSNYQQSNRQDNTTTVCTLFRRTKQKKRTHKLIRNSWRYWILKIHTRRSATFMACKLPIIPRDSDSQQHWPNYYRLIPSATAICLRSRKHWHCSELCWAIKKCWKCQLSYSFFLSITGLYHACQCCYTSWMSLKLGQI